MSVVDDECTGLAGERGEHRIDRARVVLSACLHRLRGIHEAGLRHRCSQPPDQQLRCLCPLLEHGRHGNRAPDLGELRPEHGLAVSGGGLHNDDLRVAARIRQSRTRHVVRR